MNAIPLILHLDALDTLQGVFGLIAAISTLAAALLFILSLFMDMGDGDVDVHTGDLAGDGGDTTVFSMRAIIGFLLGFGWVGYACADAQMSAVVSVLAGLLTGLVMFALVALIIRGINSLKTDGTLDYNTLVGLSGTVYVTIPPNGETGGQVQVAHPSQFLTLPAVQEGDEPLPINTPVVVTHATTGLLTVRRK